MAGEELKMAVKEDIMDGKKSKEKRKKNKDVTVDALKALPLDQQINTLFTKYAELADENRKLQVNCKSMEKSLLQIQKDKAKTEIDLSKAVLARSRLESLCRELQKQNKQIKEDSISRLKEEEERRKEVSSQFNNTFNDISKMMEENSSKNSKLREENQSMASRLQELIDLHQKREEHVDKAVTQKKLEVQLAEAKLAKAQIEFTEEKEKLLLEKKQLLEELAEYQQKHQDMSLKEISLRSQLNSYSEKYEEFQGTLDKSNQIFKNFKKEMDAMNKIIKKHEKESKSWRDKWENANKALLQMVNERSQMESKIETQAKQNLQLQSLCRALQQQLTELRTQLKKSESTSNIESNSNNNPTENYSNGVAQEDKAFKTCSDMLSFDISSATDNSQSDATPIENSSEGEECLLTENSKDLPSTENESNESNEALSQSDENSPDNIVSSKNIQGIENEEECKGDKEALLNDKDESQLDMEAVD